jgi:hypothetical protein
VCEYCGNTGLCYGFFAMALAWVYRKAVLVIRRLRRKPMDQESRKCNIRWSDSKMKTCQISRTDSDE